MEFIYLVIFIFGLYVGWKLHEMFFIHVIKTNPEIIEEACKIAIKNKAEILEQSDVEIETDDGRTIRAKGVELAIEAVNGVFYAYSKSTNQFIAQGNSIEDLLKTAHSRFPGQTFFGDLPEKEHQNT